MHPVVIIRILEVECACIFYESTLWFSQRSISEIFQTTKQNISIHTADLGGGESENISKKFSISKTEGSRKICREIVHFDIAVLAAIALRSRRYEVHEEILKVASEHLVELNQIPIRAKKEWEFGELLIGALSGITQVTEQHQLGSCFVDFYLPQFKMAIEFDEIYHARPKQVARDKYRQTKLEKEFGVLFLRVEQGKAIEGLNKILSSIIRTLKPDHSMNATVPLRGVTIDVER